MTRFALRQFLLLSRLAGITWKIFSTVSRDPGIAIHCHIIEKLIFVAFNMCAEILANRASPAHVIGPLVSH